MSVRRSTLTYRQRREIYRRADAGESRRAIAEAVFGDRRLKDRVQRLLQRRERLRRPDVDEAELRAELERQIEEAEEELLPELERMVDELEAKGGVWGAIRPDS